MSPVLEKWPVLENATNRDGRQEGIETIKIQGGVTLIFVKKKEK